MNTLCISAADPQAAVLGAQIIRDGGLVALPTETVYGLGANGLCPEAVDKIFQAKGRPNDNPLILHITGAEQISQLCREIPDSAYALAAAFWPGPLTMVLKAKDIVPRRTTGGRDTVAVRCPDSDVTREVIRLSGCPIAAPSANISGKPSTTTAQHVLDDHRGKIPLVIDGGPCRVGVESTIVDLTGERPRLLRPGGISPEELTAILGQLDIDKAVTSQIDNDAVVNAPGMKYRHYAPQCPVTIVSGPEEAAAAYAARRWQPGDRVLCFREELPLYAGMAPLAYGSREDAATLSAGLFAALRELDDPAVKRVFARCPEGGGMAYAVQNRLKKAAAFHVVDATKETVAGAHEVRPYGDEPTVVEECRGAPRVLPGTKMILGITGGTGSGKTTLLSCIRQRGGRVIDCDAVYHRLLETDEALLAAIEARFPGVAADGALDRKALGSRVFSDARALKDLNAITHEAVKQEVLRLLEDGPALAAIDAIALFESGLASLCQVTVAVTAPAEDRVRRIMARDGISEDYARSRVAAQKEDRWFRENCTHVLENTGTQAQFHKKCLAFLQSLGIMELPE